MSLCRVTVAITLATCLAAPLHAATTDYTSLIVLGDSLSDNGNLFAATGGTNPASPPYFNGRFSDGPVWAETLAAEFTASGELAANFAYGGARAIANADGIPDLQTQIGIATGNVPAAALGNRPLATLWFGANDLFGVIGSATTADVIAVGRAAATAVAKGIQALATDGVQDFLVGNLPDLGSTPLFNLFQPGAKSDATAGSDAFNTQLASDLAALRSTGLAITLLDANALFADLLADPAAYGVANPFISCIIPGVSVCADPAGLAFFDAVHPTAGMHGFVADIAIAALNPAPVPLPLPASMLGGALIGIAFLRRRAA